MYRLNTFFQPRQLGLSVKKEIFPAFIIGDKNLNSIYYDRVNSRHKKESTIIPRRQ